MTKLGPRSRCDGRDGRAAESARRPASGCVSRRSTSRSLDPLRSHSGRPAGRRSALRAPGRRPSRRARSAAPRRRRRSRGHNARRLPDRPFTRSGRDFGLRFRRQIDDARRPAPSRPAPASPSARSSGKIVAENLDGDVGPRARQHVIDAMRDRLADRHVRPRQQRHASAGSRRARLPASGPSSRGARRSRPTRRPARARRARRGPVRRAVDATSGTLSSRRSSALPSAFESARLVPGIVTALTVSAPSLNSGRNERPAPAIATRAAMSSATEAPATRAAMSERARSSHGSYTALSRRVSARLPAGSNQLRVPAGASEHSTGVTVSATTQRRRQRHDIREAERPAAAGPRRCRAGTAAGTRARRSRWQTPPSARISVLA